LQGMIEVNIFLVVMMPIETNDKGSQSS
jgi:hypothetical protein